MCSVHPPSLLIRPSSLLISTFPSTYRRRYVYVSRSNQSRFFRSHRCARSRSRPTASLRTLSPRRRLPAACPPRLAPYTFRSLSLHLEAPADARFVVSLALALSLEYANHTRTRTQTHAESRTRRPRAGVRTRTQHTRTPAQR